MTAVRRPLVAYFALAFGITWILDLPLVLARSTKGFGLLPFNIPSSVAFVVFLISILAGPCLAAVVVSGATGGKRSVRLLLRRVLQWRAGFHWYVVVLFGWPLIELVGYSVVLGIAPWAALARMWPKILATYLLSSVTIYFVLSLGEEIGWRGFALPRLQAKYGALAGTVILGFLHGLWHLPAFFVPGAVESQFSLGAYGTVIIGAMVAAVFFSWVYNNTRGSIFMVILLHAASNARIPLEQALMPGHSRAASLWGFYALLAAALLIILFTKGRLSFNPNTAPEL
jgi:membrane protease YdiL (CAAX protease family)